MLSLRPTGLLATVLLALVAGCQDGSVLVVSVAKIPPTAVSLEVLVTGQPGATGSPAFVGDFLTQDGASGSMSTPLPALLLSGLSAETRTSYKFGLRLPSRAEGERVIVGVAARDGNRCLQIAGSAQITLSPTGGNTTLTVTLDQPNPGDPAKRPADCLPTIPAIESVVHLPVSGGTDRIRVAGWGFSPAVAASLTDKSGQALPVKNLGVSLTQIEFDQPALKSDTGKISGNQVFLKNPSGGKTSAPVDLYRVAFSMADRPLLLDLSPCTPGATPAVNFPFHPDSVVIADLDGDGNKDIAMAGNRQDRGVIAVFLNKSGKGDFADPPQVFCLGTAQAPINAQSIVAADLDGDKKIDLVVSNFGQSSVTVLYNQGLTKGLFLRQGLPAYPAGDHPDSLSVADVDGDSRPDIVVAYAQDIMSLGQMNVLRNEGGASAPFTLLKMPMHTDTPTYGVAFALSFISVQDLDGDGQPDLAAIGLRIIVQNGQVLSRGGGLFVVPHQMMSPYFTQPSVLDIALGLNSYPTSGSLGHLLIRDLDGDGFPDALVSGIDRGSAQSGTANTEVSVLFNNHHGAFNAGTSGGNAVTYPAGASPYFMGYADIDGDKIPDLVVANSLEDKAGFVTVVLGKPGVVPLKRDDVFVRGDLPSFPIGIGSPSLAVDDLNGDGKPDVVVATLNQYGDPGPGHLSILLNNSRP